MHYVESPSGNKAPISSIRHLPRGYSNQASVKDDENTKDEGFDSPKDMDSNKSDDVTPIPTTDDEEWV